MSEKKLGSIIRDFLDAYFVKRDVEKALSFFTEDAVWVAYEGTFKGREELRRYMIWGIQGTPVRKFRDSGVGIIVKGNNVVYEHIEEAVMSDGSKWEVLVVCVYEFSGEKIQQHRAYYDRLSVVRQVAKGPIAERVVGALLKSWEKGLR